MLKSKDMISAIEGQSENLGDNASFSIRLVSLEIHDADGLVFNYVSFRDNTAKDRVNMVGLAIPRKHSKTWALRGVMVPPFRTEHLARDRFEHQLFCGSAREYLQKMAMAVEVLHFVNAQNLNYRPEWSTSDSPNSIATTLVRGMGLTYPHVLDSHYTPGHDRLILPRNWRSSYTSESIDLSKTTFEHHPQDPSMVKTLNCFWVQLQTELSDFDPPLQGTDSVLQTVLGEIGKD